MKIAKVNAPSTKRTSLSLRLSAPVRMSGNFATTRKSSLLHSCSHQSAFTSSILMHNTTATACRYLCTSEIPSNCRRGRKNSSTKPISSKPPLSVRLSSIVFPCGDASFSSVVQTPNSFFVDKSHFIPELETYGPATFLLAPKHFGKSLFLDMLAEYYDKNNSKSRFNQLFGNLHIGKHPTELQGKFHVLRFDFSQSLVESVQAHQNPVKYLINDAIDKFRVKYPQFPPTKHSVDGVSNLRRLYAAARLNDLPVVTIIDDYDNHINGVLGNCEIVGGVSRVNEMDRTVKQLFSLLKAAIGQGDVLAYIAGVSQLDLTVKGGGFNIGRSTLQARSFSTLFGLTASDVSRGLRSIRKMSHVDEKSLLDHIKERHGGYMFSIFDEEDEPLYNPSSVIFTLNKIQNMLNNNEPIQHVTGVLANEKDTNASSLRTALQTILANPNTESIFTKLLASNGASIPFERFDRFSLADFTELRSQGALSAVATFLFYQGCLTRSLPKKDSLKIPNAMVRVEFAEALLNNTCHSGEGIVERSILCGRGQLNPLGSTE